MTLDTFFASHPKAALAFSGGCDSAYLMYAAKQAGCCLQAYFVKSVFQPEFELEDARRLAQQLQVPLKVLSADVLAVPEVAANPANRCYYCKRTIFEQILAQAAADGYTTLLDGTNASDETADRPGMRALAELQVYSPLRECGITKAQVRAYSKQAGLFTHDKPAYACLATRIPCGVPLDADTLYRVEEAENRLFALGYRDLRVRVRGEMALLQLPAEQFAQAAAEAAVIRAQLSPYFSQIALDFSPRS